jgi:hypothetical protein
MGIIQSLLGLLAPPRKKAAAPFQQTSSIGPQENYAGYTSVPNLPMGSRGDFVPDPYRLHAPFQIERSDIQYIDETGRVFFDNGNDQVLRIPDQPLQQYFNQKKVLDSVVVAVPAHGVVVPTHPIQRGWFQQVVPEFGMRVDVIGATPAVQLSRPIAVVSNITDGGTRAPISGAKAHPTRKG